MEDITMKKTDAMRDKLIAIFSNYVVLLRRVYNES